MWVLSTLLVVLSTCEFKKKKRKFDVEYVSGGRGKIREEVNFKHTYMLMIQQARKYR